MQKDIVFLDTEVYPNYFLIVFKWLNGREEYFVRDEHCILDYNAITKILSECQTVGFNSRFYDMPMIMYALKNTDNVNLKSMSNKLIPDKKLLKEGLVSSSYEVINSDSLWCPWSYDHIDIMNVAKGRVGLKMYGARIHTANLQDMPYDHMQALSEEEKEQVRKYCVNDVNITRDLYFELKEELAIRVTINEQYNIDVRSKSDAQIAEKLMSSQLTSLRNIPSKFDFKYVPPDYIMFISEELNTLLWKFKDFEFKGTKGSKMFKKDLLDPVCVKNVKYQCGIGGLHSMEEARAIIGGSDEYLIDIDVASYYPSIILNNEYCPDNYAPDEFLPLYRSIYEDRLKAKREGDLTKADVLKIVLNGSFGKFGDQYSSLYSPNLLIHTTVTGQLSLLMLIEELAYDDFEVMSANTDGITIKVKHDRYKYFREIVESWEKRCKFKTEEVRYKSLHNQNVNSYVAIKEKGGLKCKGIFADKDLSRNPAIKICKDAIFAYIIKGKRIEDTILNASQDPINFLIVRKVEDGGFWKGKYLGKVVRWYWSTEGEPITNPKGHKVADTDDAYPIMNLIDGVRNINYDKYIKTTYKLLKTLGIEL